MSLELGGQQSFHGPEYHVTVTFRVPLRFAYAWCTDFRESDPKLEGEPYERKIVRRSAGRIIYEDVRSAPDGWHWARYDVRLEPPNKWSLLSIGNYRSIRAEYALTRRAEERTQFDMWFKREAGPLLGARVSRAAREREMTRMWRKFAVALEQDYRKSRRRRRRR
jgi:hypothetical protein